MLSEFVGKYVRQLFIDFYIQEITHKNETVNENF